MNQSSAHSARLHAACAALCALLLLVALGLMALHHAPWWALLGVQGALLVTTAGAAIWLDRAGGERRGARGEREQQGYGAPFTVTGTARYFRPGMDGRVFRSGDGGPQSTEQVFWQERMRTEEEDA